MIVCTVGDLLLDVVVRVDTAHASGDDTPATVSAGAGGQAANVAAWAAALGAEARLICRRGSDAAGRACSDELAARGVEVVGRTEGRNGVVVSLVAADGSRTMLSDRGVAPELRAEELDPAWLDDCRALHVSGYALSREPLASAAARAAELARDAGAQVSLDLSARSLIDDAFRARAALLRPDRVFATEPERDALADDLGAAWVVKRGASGVVVDGRGHPAAPADVVDTTGAGDALAAGILVGGPELGLQAAARCVARLGSMP